METCNNISNWYFLRTYGGHIVSFAFLLSVFPTPPLLLNIGVELVPLSMVLPIDKEN